MSINIKFIDILILTSYLILKIIILVNKVTIIVKAHIKEYNQIRV